MKANVLLFIPEDIIDNSDLEPYNYHKSGPLENFLRITIETTNFDRETIALRVKKELKDILLDLELDDVTNLPLAENLLHQIKHIEEIHETKDELRRSLTFLEQLVSEKVVDELTEALFQRKNPKEAIKTISDEYLREFLLEYFATQISNKRVPIIFKTDHNQLPKPENTNLPSSTTEIELHDKEDKRHYPAQWSEEERVMVVQRLGITMVGEYLEIERMNSAYDLINSYLEDGTDVYWNIKERLESSTNNIKTQIVGEDPEAIETLRNELQELSNLLDYADQNLLIPLDQTTLEDLKKWRRGKNMQSVVSRHKKHDNEYVGKRDYPPKNWLKQIQPLETIRSSRKKIQQIRDQSSEVSAIIRDLVQAVEKARKNQERWNDEKRLKEAKIVKERVDTAINATIKLAELAEKLHPDG